ncbi:hypothetical protein HanRHA438_Chr09g0428011 [Helianthus annuus]|nr:hypothetical protein HanRHA438_Chr09g0428011 [Helianthus annuus]
MPYASHGTVMSMTTMDEYGTCAQNSRDSNIHKPYPSNGMVHMMSNC